jgi:hypothetical protein
MYVHLAGHGGVTKNAGTRHLRALFALLRVTGTRLLGSIALFLNAGADGAVPAARPEHVGLTGLCYASCQARTPQSDGTRQ